MATTKRRTSPRRAASQAVPSNPLDGALLEALDPRVINWPDNRITSESNEEKLAALRESMAELGQQDAVGVVQLEDGTYEGATGMNRCLAAIESGMAQVLCLVRQGNHRDVVMSNLATSINRSRANPLSEAEGIANALNEGFKLGELLRITGKSRAWIEDRLVIDQASTALKECLREGRITIGHAAVLANIEDQAAQEEALRDQLARTVEELEVHVRGVVADVKESLASHTPIPDYDTLEDEYDLEALKHAATLVLTSATPDAEAPGSSRVSDDSLARLRDALRDPYILDL